MNRKLIAAGAGFITVFALAGCTSAVATTSVREITLDNGKVVTCVIAGASSGSPSISCDWEHERGGE